MEELKAIHSTMKQLKRLKPYDQNSKGKGKNIYIVGVLPVSCHIKYL